MATQTTAGLAAYAEERIEALDLGDGGPLGTEFVVAYDDAGDGRVRISDGHAEEVCDSKESVDAALKGWADWVAEDETADAVPPLAPEHGGKVASAALLVLAYVLKRAGARMALSPSQTCERFLSEAAGEFGAKSAEVGILRAIQKGFEEDGQ